MNYGDHNFIEITQ